MPRKNVETRPPLAFGQSPTKSLASVRKCTPKRRSGQTTSGCLSTPTARLPRRPAAMPRKSTAPDSLQLLVNPLQKVSPAFRNVPRKSATLDSLRLLVNPLQKVSPAFRNVPRKNIYARPLPAVSSHRPRGFPSDPLRRLEKVQLQTASSFWSIPRKKSLQPSEIYPEKNIQTRPPPAFGQSSTKSLSSLRRFTPKKRSRQTAFGFWSILRERYLQPSEMCPEKIFTPDSLRLLVNLLQKVPLAFGDLPRKKHSDQTAFGFWSILCGKPLK